MPYNLHSNVKLFTDDEPLYVVITSDTDCDTHLQEDLCKLEEWQNLWQMELLCIEIKRCPKN